MEESFGIAIREHLELQARNRLLEPELPIARYRAGAPQHAAATSANTVGEDTQEWTFPDGEPARLREPLLEPVDELWSVTPAFDWGD